MVCAYALDLSLFRASRHFGERANLSSLHVEKVVLTAKTAGFQDHWTVRVGENPESFNDLN